MLTNPQMGAMVATLRLVSYAKTQGCSLDSAVEEMGLQTVASEGAPLLEKYEAKSSAGHQTQSSASATSDRLLQQGWEQTYMHQVGNTNPYVITAFKKK